MITLVLCLIIVATAVASFAYACGGFDFLLYQQKTRAWNIDLGTTYRQQPRTLNIVAESDDKKDESITYDIEMCGPKGFNNKDITLSWKDSMGQSFTIGNGGSQAFTGTGTLSWHSGCINFKHDQKNSITLTLTFLATSPSGKYSAEMWIGIG